MPLLLGYFSIPHIVRPLVRRALRNKYFAPTSERFVAKIAGPAPKDPRTAYEAAYQSRGKPKGRRGPKRLRALGRNGFYYDR